MANKTFKDFTQIGKDDENQEIDIKPLGTEQIYLVGYQVTPATDQTAELQQEIRIEIEDHIKKTASYYQPGNIESGVIQYDPQSGGSAAIRRQTVEEKLNNFLSTEDYIINNANETAASQVAKGRRLFVGDGQTAIVTVGQLGSTLADYTSISEALEAISKWHIESNALVVIKLLTDVEVSTTTILNHPQGERIHIIGSPTPSGYSQIRISTTAFGVNDTPNFDLLQCTDGHRIGLIDQIELIGNPVSLNDGWGSMTGKAAIRSSRQSYINLGANVKITNWYYGVLAEYGSVIRASQIVDGILSGITIQDSGYAGVCATHGSHIDVSAVSSSNARLSTEEGYGIAALHGSQIVCDKAEVFDNERAGIAAFSGSEICAMGVVTRNNGSESRSVFGSGFLSSNGGFIECSNLTVDGNTTLTESKDNYGYGFEYLNGGTISGNTGNSVNNSLGLTNKFALSTTRNSVAALESNDTLLGIYTTKGQQVEIASPPSESTARLVMTGGTSTQSPSIAVAGSDAKIDVRISPKGSAGRVFLGSNVSFGTMQSFAGIPPITGAAGYITITDNSNQTRRLVVY